MAQTPTPFDQSTFCYTQLMIDRENMLNYKSVFQGLVDKFSIFHFNDTKNNNILTMHGLTHDELNELDGINNSVQRGKEKLKNLLQTYDKCVKDIDTINQKINEVGDKIHSYEHIHNALVNLDNKFKELLPSIKDVRDIKSNIVDDLELQLASTSIEKDKLEAMILSLGRTYNILRTAPLVHTCPICMTNEVDTFFVPCGHTVCKDCVSGRYCNSNKFCHMCRVSIREIRKLYYS